MLACPPMNWSTAKVSERFIVGDVEKSDRRDLMRAGSRLGRRQRKRLADRVCDMNRGYATVRAHVDHQALPTVCIDQPKRSSHRASPRWSRMDPWPRSTFTAPSRISKPPARIRNSLLRPYRESRAGPHRGGPSAIGILATAMASGFALIRVVFG